MLTLNTIRSRPGSTFKNKRLGRGPGSGTGGTAGKGHKGQLARSGGRTRPGFEGGQTPLYRRLPKRGFKSLSRTSTATINVADFERFSSSTIDLETLKAAEVLKGRFDRLVVLGTGDLKKAYQVKAHKVSATALEKIKKAGGSVEVIVLPSLLEERIQQSKSKRAKSAQ